MSRLLILAPVLVMCVACNNQQGREAYYQSRVTPTSTADAYGVSAQLTWGDNHRQIYELPTEAPDRKAEAPPREDCEKPGPKFKGIPLVAWGSTPVRSSGYSERTDMVATKADRPAGDLVGLRQHPMVGGYGSMYRPGISQPPYLVRTGASDIRPRSVTGVGLDEQPVQPLMGYNDRFNPYCERDPSMGVLPVDPPPVEEKRSGVDAPFASELAPPRK